MAKLAFCFIFALLEAFCVLEIWTAFLKTLWSHCFAVEFFGDGTWQGKTKPENLAYAFHTDLATPPPP